MGIWDVKASDDREQWTYEPVTAIGPLRFGMRAVEVSEALGDRPSSSRSGQVPTGEMRLVLERFSRRGVVAFYTREGALAGVAVDAQRGPQVRLEGEELTGRVPSEMEAWLTGLLESRDLGLLYTQDGNPASVDLGLVLRAQRAGDVVLTRPLFLIGDWVDNLWDSLPAEEWHTF
ncbi:hypothetical protein [Glycomyces harbinensis]|uniref:Uncharacterized protein n=1 Tax=Glycomyces harbinensis TaxID=58114 RepID=A0A1G7C3K4_9ACTN|nr:hypothetical protein [Glycomyces harbinensis]SDE33891.1 hypothetical protein SAMN05216270_118128 [Glycomyces harbinensis]